MALDFQRRHFQPEVILMLIRWYVAYALSYRHVHLDSRHHITIRRF